jgi:hypothetical protein
MPSYGYSVVPVQKAVMALRIVQVVFSVIVLGTAAYIVSLTDGYGSDYVFTPGALAVFTAIATWIFSAYWFFANTNVGHKFYNYWAIMAVEFFVWVFWLTTFALYASYISGTLNILGGYGVSGSDPGSGSGGSTYCYNGYCVSYKRSLEKRYYTSDTDADTISSTIYTTLAFSVLNFVLFSVTIVLYVINLSRHRAAQASAEQNHSAHVEAGGNVAHYKA